MNNHLFYIFLALVYHVPQFIGRFKYLHDVGVAQVEEKNVDRRQGHFGMAGNVNLKARKIP